MQTQPYTEALEKALGGVIARANAELAGVKERMDAAVAAANARVAEAEAKLLGLESRIADRLASLKDGISVTLEDVTPMIEARIEESMASIREPVDGTSVTVDDVRPLLQEMVDAIPRPKDGVGVTLDDVAPMIVGEIERQVEALPPAEPGRSVTVDDVVPVLQAMVDALPVPKDGASVTVEDVAPLIAAQVEERVAAIPVPKDGASVTVDDIRPLLQEMVDAIPRPKDGAPGAPGKLDAVKAWDDRVHYEGEIVTHEGSTYQASTDTGRAPPHADWACLARAGRDGTEGASLAIEGTFDPERADYRRLSIVALNGGSFVARRDNPGACPGDGWQLLASVGKRGQPGERGPAGRGDRGPAGPGVTGLQTSDQGLITLTNGDGSAVELDLYPLLSKLQG